MSEHFLSSLLPRGTKTWQNGDHETTIDLILASEELASQTIKCAIHPVEHGSDHRALETTFDISTPERVLEPRLLFKNAPWKAIKSRISINLLRRPMGGTVQDQSDQLMSIGLEAIHTLTPKAKPSPYAKRWWTQDLTQLRRIYTYHRNRARAMRRANCAMPELERRAKNAAKEYHDAIRKQKKSHWENFLDDDANIWKAARYLKPDTESMFDKVPPLEKADGTTTNNKPEQVIELLNTFFPSLPEVIEEEGQQPQRASVSMPRLTIDEIERKILSGMEANMARSQRQSVGSLSNIIG